MKLSKAKSYLPFVQAAAEGKIIQFHGKDGRWRTFADLDFGLPSVSYRIKPEPTLRAWRPDEVPVGARIKNIGDEVYTNAMILSVTGRHIEAFTYGCKSAWTFERALTALVHSTDGGASWKPCGILE